MPAWHVVGVKNIGLSVQQGMQQAPPESGMKAALVVGAAILAMMFGLIMTDRGEER